MSFVFVSPAGGAPIGTGSALAQAEGEAAEESAQAGNAGEGTTTTTAPPLPNGPNPTFITNVVFLDLNNNGVRDGGEGPLVGVGVTLFDDNGNGIATTTTNDQGRYHFGPGVGVVPGTVYTARFDASSNSTGLPGSISNRELRTPTTRVVTERSNDSGLGIPYDLALNTTVDFDSINENSRTARFNLTVINQGAAVDTFEVIDYFDFPNAGQWEGFNAGLNSGGSAGGRSWSWDASNPQRPVVRVNGNFPSGAQMTIPVVMRWNGTLPDGTSQLVNWAEIASFGFGASTTDSRSISDRDSVPDRIAANDSSNQDDRSGAAFDLFDLALEMTLDDGAELRSVIPDSRVTFTVTVRNEGILSASNIAITNYLPPIGLRLDDDDWSPRGDGTAVTGLDGTLAPGASRSVDITFLVSSTFTGDVRTSSEISRASAADSSGNLLRSVSDRDSTADSISSNDSGSEDDFDGAAIRIGFFDLAVRTTLAGGFELGEAPIGNAVVFNIEIANEGEVPATDIQLRNYLPREGLILVDPDWTDNGRGVATLNTPIPGPIPEGRSTVVPITFIVDASASGTIYNWAEIASADNDSDTTTPGPIDVDSEPGNGARYNIEPNIEDRLARIEAAGGDEDDIAPLSREEREPSDRDEDDHDFAGVRIDEPVLDLAIQIRVSDNIDADELGLEDDVSFTITIFNEGNVFAKDVAIADYLPGVGLDLVDPKWRDTGEGFATRTLDDPLAPGDAIEIEIDFVVGAGAVNTITNSVEILNAMAVDFFDEEIVDANGEALVDIDSVRGNNSTSEDDQSSAAVHFEAAPVYDLAIWSDLSNGSDQSVFAPGDTVSYVLTLFNEGEVAAEEILLTMDMPAGFELTNRDWDRNDNGTVTLTIPGPLHPGEQATAEVAFRAGPDAVGNNDHEIWISGATLLDGRGRRLSETNSALLADFDVVDNATTIELNAIPTLAFNGAEAKTGQLFGWALLAAATFVALMLAAYTNRKPPKGEGVRMGQIGPAPSRWGPAT